jgi:hypothetical protein
MSPICTGCQIYHTRGDLQISKSRARCWTRFLTTDRPAQEIRSAGSADQISSALCSASCTPVAVVPPTVFRVSTGRKQAFRRWQVEPTACCERIDSSYWLGSRSRWASSLVEWHIALLKRFSKAIHPRRVLERGSGKDA